jgi:hypothetical protein
MRLYVLSRATLLPAVAAAIMTTAPSDAAVVAINLASLGAGSVDATGVNGGAGASNRIVISDWLGAGSGSLRIWNGRSGLYGLEGILGSGGINATHVLEFAWSANTPTPNSSSPAIFASGSSIGSASSFSSDEYQTAFRGGAVSPDLGANSYMGFRFGPANGTGWHYGYLEVTWTASTNQFFLISGAYESTADTAIAAGASPTPVPAPGAAALLAIAGVAGRRRRS